MLKPLAPHLHGCEHEAVADEVRRVAHAFTRFEADGQITVLLIT